MQGFIRRFQPKDRQAVLTIGAETAFFGAPIERYMEDRRIFMDAFYAYYTDCEPEHCWVVQSGEQVVGFLTGCVDTRRHDALMQRRLIPTVAWRMLRGGYHPGPRTWRYARAALGAALRAEIPGPDLLRYPAHLHINLLPAWRGQGLGRQLMEAYIRQLRGLDVPGVFLQTTSLNQAAVRLYEKVGFKLLGAKRTTMYEHLVEGEVENRCYGMELRRLAM